MARKIKREYKDNWPIVAGVLIGVGVGIFIGKVAALTLIGLGVGILVTFWASRKR